MIREAFFRVVPVFACLAAVLCSGCGTCRVNVACQAVVEKEDAGRGVQVVVKAADTRPDPVVGQRDPGMKMLGTVEVEPSVVQTLQTAVSRGLSDKGFVPSPASPAVVRTLTVELTRLAYTGTPRLGGITAEARVVILARADNNGETLEKTYDATTQWKLSGSNVEPDFDRLLGQTFSKVVSKMVGDYELLNFLVKTVLRTRDLN
ncbi:MAG: YajG family lipoprotein [Thermodesulfobacteriota bacterium]